jgi:hypothetical protein
MRAGRAPTTDDRRPTITDDRRDERPATEPRVIPSSARLRHSCVIRAAAKAPEFKNLAELAGGQRVMAATR